tara:strand:+ start:329 stop:802 length:474 start_codon:yes stop_codon:yes gene_type:complete
LSNFQEELRNDYGYENIAIIAVGQTNISSFNENFCANSNLPLVMDSYPDLPIREQFYPNGLDHYLVILDYVGNYINHIDLISLGNDEKNYIISVLEEHYQQSNIGDINEDNTINIQDIIIVVNIILGQSSIQDSADLNQDGFVNILDILQLVNLILS